MEINFKQSATFSYILIHALPLRRPL